MCTPIIRQKPIFVRQNLNQFALADIIIAHNTFSLIWNTYSANYVSVRDGVKIVYLRQNRERS